MEHARGPQFSYAANGSSRFDGHRMTSWFMHPISVLASTAALLAAAAGAAYWWVRAHRKSPVEMERERRTYLVKNGRIIDGTILDWTEQPDTGDLWTLHYRYEIAGAMYQCAQDLAHLKDIVQVDVSCLGMPASVRYDPKNPANSVIVAEAWSGLHHQNSSHGSPDA